jgi:hypothetical protein
MNFDAACLNSRYDEIKSSFETDSGSLADKLGPRKAMATVIRINFIS